MNASKSSLVLLMLASPLACGDVDLPTSNNVSANVTGEKMITGSLAIEANADPIEGEAVPDLVKQRQVLLESADGTVVASAYSDSEGSYQIQVPGNLVLAADSDEPGEALAAGNVYNVSSVIPDDGNGKVLAVKIPVELTTKTFAKGAYDAGTEVFAEISAIKGKVKFANPDGTENTTINKIGTEVYLPGYSFFAKTDGDGKFLILYVPPDTYDIRIEKNLIVKELTAEVEQSTTLDLGEIVINTDTQKPTVAASLLSTDFRNPTCVSLSVDETANIYYTVDGSNPQATNSFLYSEESVTCGTSSCPICIANETTTLKYLAVDTIGNQGDLGVQTYFYNEKWADPSDTVAPTTTLKYGTTTLSNPIVTLTAPTTFTLTANENATIYYTTDGTTPTTSSAIFDHEQSLTTTTTITYFAVDWAGNVERVKSQSINILNWHRINHAGSPPAVAFLQDRNTSHGMIYDASRSQILLFCNGCGTSSADTTWKFSGSTWTQLGSESISAAPASLVYNSSNSKTYLISNTDGTTSGTFQVRTFDHNTNSWTALSVSGISSPASTMWESAATYNSATGLIVYRYSTLSHGTQTYSFNPSTNVFSLMDTTNEQFVRLAYDASREKVIGFGQNKDLSSGYTGGTYEQSDSSWTKVTTNTVPTSDVLAYDSVRQRIVTFGSGARGHESASDATWSYTGSDWALASPPTKPKPRNSPFLVYDSANDRIIVYGGTDRFNQSLSDMWAYSK